MEQLLETTEEDAEVGTPSAYPPSVQPGIPTLGETPIGWCRLPMGELLEPVIRPADLEDNVEYQLVTAKRSRGGIVPRERLYGRDIKTKTQFFVKGGDFLISRRQISHGACGLVPASLSDAVVSNEYSALRTKAGLDFRFLQHLTHSVYFQQTCFHSSIGVHVEKLVFKIEDWLGWEFDIPRLPEQWRIADALDAWDRAIATAEALIKAKHARYTGLIQWLFGQLLSCEQVKLSSLADLNLRTLPENADPNLYIQYFDLASVSVEEGEKENLSGWTTFGEAPSRARRCAQPGDVVYGTVRPLLRRMFLAPDNPNAVYSTGYAILQTKKGNSANFVFHLLRSRHVEKQIFASLTGSGYPALNSHDLGDIEVPLVEIKEQVKAAAVLDAAAADADADEQRVLRLRRQKRGLMQKLLTGEWRLSGDEVRANRLARAAS
jgi:type I restriction enzyme S subunit